MSTTVTRLGGLSPDARDRAVDEAASALRDGGLVVFPTETIYGVGADASNPDAVARLSSAIGATATAGSENPPAAGGAVRWWSWHAAPGDLMAESTAPELTTAVARRLVARLTPGPVRFNLEQPSERVRQIEDALGLADDQIGTGIIGVIGPDGSARLAVRVADHPVAHALLERCGRPVIAAGLGQALWRSDPGDDRFGRAVGSIASAHDTPLPAVVLDDGPARFGGPSTLVTIERTGRFEVAAGGPLDEPEVLGVLKREILFVCTGNTCRSPMAEAIARSVLAERTEDGITTTVRSAGVAAGDGMDAAQDAIETMRERGIDLSAHRSQMATREMIARAERVYTMTPSHAEALMQMAPEAIDRIEPIDPMGLVEDPVGRGLEVYRRTADQLEKLIRQRLEELEP